MDILILILAAVAILYLSWDCEHIFAENRRLQQMLDDLERRL